jgi:murein L,D-transpeptidase YcbB/YkuD
MTIDDGPVFSLDAFKPPVTLRNWIGAGLGLALCSTALPSCSKSSSPANENAAQSLGQQAWSDDAARELQEIIAQAPANGLKPELFLKGDLPNDEAQRAAVLTDVALRYAGALAHGFADPSKISDVYTIPRPRVDIRQGLAQALRDRKLAEWYASLPPQTGEYKALSQAHLHYLKLANRPQPQPIADGKPIKPGAHDARIPVVAAMLKSIGYLQQPAAEPALYSPDLVAAVKRVQIEFGLKPDGIVGGDTLAALNLGPAGRARELAIAMERLRWLVRNPPATRIDVNTASTILDYWRDGQHVDRREVVAGEPDKPTPQIQAPLFQLVANPKWRVPDSIAESELSKKSQSWLSANDFGMEDGRYVQQSGPKNSLGLVKFDMRDKQQIYLHDTPAKALFALPERHRSHGCVRVQDALAFAHALATENGVESQFGKALASGDESYVKLKTEIPVRLLYHTAFWDGQAIQFRPDVYGWDDNVAAALGLVRGAPRQPYEPQGEDIGP